MVDSIKDIFKTNIKLLDQIDKLIYYFRIQNYDYALRIVTSLINQLNSFTEILLENSNYFNEEEKILDIDVLLNIMGSMLEAQANRDYILLADLYELQLNPYLVYLQDVIMNKEDIKMDEELYKKNISIVTSNNTSLLKYMNNNINNLDSDYHIEYSSIGLYTLALLQNGKRFYIHSNNNIINEAFTLANSWYSDEKRNYIVYGLGLGYHIKELYQLDNNIQIEVFESDINIIQMACGYADISSIFSNSNVKLTFDPDFTQFGKRINRVDSNTEIVIHYPSLRNIKDKSIKAKLDEYFLQYSSYRNQKRLLNGNFDINIQSTNHYIDELMPKLKGKDLYIVAAGPSLDKNFMKLKELGENAIILATGTVYRKLLNAGIRPDYFIITDANERVYAQIRGFENETIPMIFLSTAYHGFASNYKGDKYLILQYDYDKSEKYAKEKGVNLYKTGGSVSTTALDIGITLGCKRIIFLGLDLAFTDNFVHATNTSRRELASTDDLRQIEDINGELVYTSKSLDIYRKWIENRIMDVKDLEIIDATEGGAKIKGMKIAKLSDVINNNL